MLQVLFVVAYVVIIALILAIATRRSWPVRPVVIALVAVAVPFWVFSILSIVQEGLWQFWLNHTLSLAGAQVWLDLLLSVSVAFFLIAPRARAAGMPLLPWAIAIAATASLALLPMLARLLWLESKAGQRGQ